MKPLEFVAVHEDGRHLVLVDPEDRETEYLLPVDERLRAATRHRPLGGEAGSAPGDTSPRRVQAMMRAGHGAEEIAEVTGWPLDRVLRFEAPITAEREHVAEQARRAHVRGRLADGSQPTLAGRVHERLQARGVDPDRARWDAVRPDGGTWTVLLSFTAANRQRQAAWRYEPADHTVEALDDEARWLSEDEQVLPGGAEAFLGTSRTGGVDLMTTMRERSQARGRRRRRGGEPAGGKVRGGRSNPANVPAAAGPTPEALLPLEDFPYDPDTMGPPPAAGRPEETFEPVEELAGQPGQDPAAEPDQELAEESGQDSAAFEDPSDEVDETPQDATLDDFFGPEEDLADDADPVEAPGEDLGRDTDRDQGREDPGEDALEDASAGGPAPESDVAAEDEDPAGPTPSAVAENLPRAGAGTESGPQAATDSRREGGAEPGPQDGGPEPEPAGASTGRSRRKGRTSVPSWDDIMFGTSRKG